MSHTVLTARLLPWPEDVPCDQDLVGTFEFTDVLGFARVTVFEDELMGPLPIRDRSRAEWVTLALDPSH